MPKIITLSPNVKPKVQNISYIEQKQLLDSFPKQTIKTIKVVASLITSNIPTDATPDLFYSFLRAIKPFNPSQIEASCQEYLKKEYYAFGKGFKYLQAIIINSGTNNKSMVKAQNLKYGRKFNRKELI